MNKEWPHILSFVCIDVHPGDEEVLLVCRSEGEWSFLCGEEHPESPDWFQLLGMSHLLERDPTLAQVLNLRRNQSAERKERGGRWHRVPTSQIV